MCLKVSLWTKRCVLHQEVLVSMDVLHSAGHLLNRWFNDVHRWRPYIDGAFCDLTGIQEDLTEFGTAIRQRLLQWVGIPVGVGIGSTKTLAKLANWAAKKWPATGGVVDLRDPLRQQRLLKLAPATTVWGVGRRLGVRLAAMNIHTAWDLAQCDPAILRMTFGVTVERAGREPNGQSCLDVHEAPPVKKNHLHPQNGWL
jgi:DNA polymerase V